MSRPERSGREPRRRREPTPIGDIVSEIVRSTEEEAVRPIQRLRAAWTKIEREGRFDGTRVANFKNGSVVIEVKSPPLCAELSQFRRRDLLARLQGELGGEPPLKELKFRLGAW